MNPNQPSRGFTKLLNEKVAENSGNYLSAKDFKQPRRFRPMKWLYEGKIVEMVAYLEGWVNVKGKQNGAPIRFKLDDEIPQDLNWKMSSGYSGGKEKPQTPQPAIAMLVEDYKTQSIKLVTFTQKTVIGAISSWLEEEVNGVENELYIPDLSEVDIIITAGEKAYTVTSQAIKKRSDVDKLLDGFKFSWEEFMQCNDPFDEFVETSYDDVVEAMGGNKPDVKKQSNKNVKQKEQKKQEEDFNWEEVRAPDGKMLGALSDEKLERLGSALEEDDNTDKESILYKAVIKGLEERGLDIPF